MHSVQIHQADMIRSNRKLVFYSSFKTDQSKTNSVRFNKKYTA